MKLILLGSGGYRPNDRRHTACVMLPEMGLILDAGTAFYRVPPYVQTSELHVLLTHAHLDHVVGLTFLFDLLATHPNLKVYVHAEAEKLATIERHLWYPGLFPARPPCQFVPMTAESLTSLPGKPQWFPLEHPGGSVGFRFDLKEGSFAYVTDTTAEPQAPYVSHIHGVDLLVHECYFRDHDHELAHKTGHSCTSAVAEVAKHAQVGQLVLVHMNPLDASDDPIDLALARKIFPATSLGEDLQEIVLTRPRGNAGGTARLS